jgi:hypothetical protein
METEVIFSYMWKNLHETIVDIRVTDTDANAYTPQNPYYSENKKRRRRRRRNTSALIWLDQHRSFVPFVASADGLIGRKTKNLLT